MWLVYGAPLAHGRLGLYGAVRGCGTHATVTNGEIHTQRKGGRMLRTHAGHMRTSPVRKLLALGGACYVSYI